MVQVRRVALLLIGFVIVVIVLGIQSTGPLWSRPADTVQSAAVQEAAPALASVGVPTLAPPRDRRARAAAAAAQRERDGQVVFVTVEAEARSGQ